MSGRQTVSGGLGQNARGPILIVDDNQDDAALTKRAVLSLHPDMAVHLVDSGKALLNYLETESATKTGRQIASLILLDLRMPEMDGFAVLEWLKTQPKYGEIPVIVISAFDDLSQLRRAYALMARTYLLKPIRPDSFYHALSSLNINL